MAGGKKPKAVFWDMDGTLVDSEPLHEQALVSALHSVGIAAPADLHDRVVGQAAVPVYEMMRDEFGLSLPFHAWIRRKYEHYLPHAGGLLARPGAIEIFRAVAARDIPQAIVSNSDRLVVDANLRAVGLAEPGLKSISRNDVRDGKPSPEAYLRAAWLFDVDPTACFVMEDSPTGAQAGLAAGMTTVFWPQTPITGPAGALVAETAEDVRRLLGLA